MGIEDINARSLSSGDFDPGINQLLASLNPPQWSREPLVGEIKQVEGCCHIRSAHDSRLIEGFRHLGLRWGDRLSLARAGSARISLDLGCWIWLKGEAELTLTQEDGLVRLGRGRMTVLMSLHSKPLKVQTPALQVIARSGASFVVVVTGRNSATLRIYHGRIIRRDEQVKWLLARSCG